MHRDISSWRLRQTVRAPASGPLDHQASHGPGTTGGGDGTARVAQAVLASTAARTLALGDRLNSSWLKDTDISMVTVMEKPANHLDNYLEKSHVFCGIIGLSVIH